MEVNMTPYMDEDAALLSSSILTAAHAFDYWPVLLFYGQDFDGTEIDPTEAQAAAIGWASRDQNEVIG